MTQSAYPWDVLGIDETDNKKTIKKAYAILIKQYKPDEHPDMFKEVQDAYQYALQLIKWDIQNQKDSNTRDSITIDNPQDINKSPEKHHSDQIELDIIQKLLEKTKILLQSNILDRENKFNWGFIECSNQIIDIQFREQFSQQLFELFSKYNVEFYKKNKRTIVSTRIIRYINNYVNWETKWQEYQYLYNDSSMHVMYKNIEHDDEIDTIVQLDLTDRLKTLFSDLIMSYAIAGISSYFTGVSYQETIKLAFIIFIMQRFLLELLFNKSMGKFNDNAYIVDNFGNKCSLAKTTLRHLIINATLIPIHTWLFQWNIDPYIWVSIFCVMVLLNLVSMLKDEKFIHDVFTKTLVLKKTGAFEFT